jgi:hypothetical protein
VPRENTPGRITKSTGATEIPEIGKMESRDAEDLRADYSEQIGEVATELSWEREKELPASILGPRLNRRIKETRKRTRGKEQPMENQSSRDLTRSPQPRRLDSEDRDSLIREWVFRFAVNAGKTLSSEEAE